MQPANASPRWLTAVGVMLVVAVAVGTALATPLLWRTNALVAVLLVLGAAFAIRGLWRHWPAWRATSVAARARREANALSIESLKIEQSTAAAAETKARLAQLRRSLEVALAHGAPGPLAEALASLNAEVEPHRRTLRPAARFALALAFGLLVALVLRTFVVGVYRIPTVSMVPTLLVGDHLLVDRLAYRSASPVAGDVVVLERADEDGVRRPYAKRVIALPGQVVSFSGRQLLVDGAPVSRELVGEVQLDAFGDPAQRRSFFFDSELWEEHLGDRRYTIVQRRTAPLPAPGPWRVPEGHVFVLGDNRDDSTDSRDETFGPVPLSSIVGRARWVLFSTGGDAGWRSGRALLPVK